MFSWAIQTTASYILIAFIVVFVGVTTAFTSSHIPASKPSRPKRALTIVTTQDVCDLDNSVYGISTKLKRSLCATPKILRRSIQQGLSSLQKKFQRTEPVTSKSLKNPFAMLGSLSPRPYLNSIFDIDAAGKQLTKVMPFEDFKEEVARGTLEGLISETLAVLMNEDAGLDVPTDASRMMVHGIGSDFSDVVRLSGVYFKKAVQRTLFSAVISQTSGTYPTKQLSSDFKPDWNWNHDSMKELPTDLELKVTIGSIKRLVVPLFVRSVAHTIPTMAVHFSADVVRDMALHFPNFF